jgi:hypothetical protein
MRKLSATIYTTYGFAFLAIAGNILSGAEVEFNDILLLIVTGITAYSFKECHANTNYGDK